MDVQTMYPVCPHRNVAAAYQCFLGPDSRGIERFFATEGIHWPNDAVLSEVVADFNPALTWWWLTTSYALSALVLNLAASTAVCSKFLLYRAIRTSAPRIARIAAALTEFCGVWLPRGWRHGSDAAAVLGRWAAHYRLPFLSGSRTVGGLPI